MEKNEIQNNHNFKIVILIAIFAIICFSNLNISYGADTTVTNSNNSTEIQDAINSMSDGDVLTFTTGNYNNITLNVNKSITLNGSGSTINGTGIMISGYNAFNITVNNVKIQNFKIQNYNIGISVRGNNTLIKNNTLTSNNYGIYLYASSSNNLTNNTATSNTNGIYLDASSSNNLTNNNAISNTNGIFLYALSSNNLLTNNTAINNKNGIYLHGSTSNNLINNTANSNIKYGIFLDSSSSNNLTNNTANINIEYGIYLYVSSSNNLINNTANDNYYGISLSSSSSNNLTGNSICDNMVAIYLERGVMSNVFSYNRIAGNIGLIKFLPDTMLLNNKVNFNWWGNNNPTEIMNITGFEVTNWFIIKLNSTKTSANIGENIGYNYYFILNDGSIVDSNLLPNFNGTITINGADSSFLGKKSFTNTATVGPTGLNIIATLDQEKISLTITNNNLVDIVNPTLPTKNTTSLSLFLDRPYGYGYIVGEIATVTWVTIGIANLNQRAMIQFIEDGKVWHTQYVLLSDGKYLHKFILSHKTLDVVMIFLGDNNSYGLSDKVPTYVDPVNDRRTFVEIKNMSNLTVGKKGNIDIIVKDYKGDIIKTGKVTLKFDNKWSFTVNIKNGVAKFSKIFTKSGNNRTLKITYIKDGNNLASSIATKIVVNKK